MSGDDLGTLALDLDKWLDQHHRVEDKERTNGDEIHVFAVEHGDVFGADSTIKHWEISFHLGPLTIKVVVELDLAKKTLSITVYGKLPFLPEFKIASGSGSIQNGITLKFNLKVIQGEFRFYVKDKWLWLDYNVKVLGKQWKGTLKLIPLPI